MGLAVGGGKSGLHFPDSPLVRQLRSVAAECGDRWRSAKGHNRVASPAANLQALNEAQGELFRMLEDRSVADRLARAELMRTCETIASTCLKKECPPTLVGRWISPTVEIAEGTIPPGAVDPDQLRVAIKGLCGHLEVPPEGVRWNHQEKILLKSTNSFPN